MFGKLNRLTITGIIIAAITYLSACQSTVNSEKKDDTTAALKILLDSAFYKHRLSEPGVLNPTESIEDTIIFLRNNTLIRHLPPDLTFQLLTQDEMCGRMAAGKTSNLQFFALDEFIKTANGYKAALGTHCMTQGTMQTYPEETPHSYCEPQKYCNSVMYMVLTKTEDEFIANKPYFVTY